MANKKEKKRSDVNTVTDRYATEFSQELGMDANANNVSKSSKEMEKAVQNREEYNKTNGKGF